VWSEVREEREWYIEEEKTVGGDTKSKRVASWPGPCRRMYKLFVADGPRPSSKGLSLLLRR
jgi:hypothetical protein